MAELRIGIIGLGTVGNAIVNNFNFPLHTVCIDVDVNKNTTGTYEEILKTDIIFVCVPSPMKDDYSCDTRILENTLKKLKQFKGVIVSKVTAPPDVYKKLGKIYPNLVYCPEFLRENSANLDYAEAKWLVIGGSVKAYMHESLRIMEFLQPNVENAFFCTLEEASIFKYTVNTFLAQKVVFFNQIKSLCDKSKIDYNKLLPFFELDPRLGNSHFRVPGEDGNFGFGGKCFPKDVNAFIKYSTKQRSKLTLLDEANKINTLLRLK